MSHIGLLDRPIAFHRCLAELTGSITAGLMLSQGIYWHSRTPDGSGWFWKTQEDWHSETAMGRKEQESARRRLRELSFDGRPIWREELRGVPAKMFYFVDVEALLGLLQYAQNGHSSMPKRGILESPKGTNKQAPFGHTFITEITSETTTETTFFSDKRAPRVSGKKRGVVFDSFDFKTLAELFDQGTHEWLVANCPTVSVEAASTAFLDYHRTRGTSFRSARAILSAWRGWMVKAEERAGVGAGKGSNNILSEAELESLRRMGVEV